MLVFDPRAVGVKLQSIRKRMGLTQAEAAEKAGLSDRAYADIERGNTNMRLDTALRICQALHITPNELLTESSHDPTVDQVELFQKLQECSPKDRETALALLSVYLRSLT